MLVVADVWLRHCRGHGAEDTCLELLHAAHDIVGFAAESFSTNRHANKGYALQGFGPEQLVAISGCTSQQLGQQRHHAVIVSNKVRLCTVRH